MQLKWLEDYIALAETRSFSRASAERSVTQPAFGRRIKALEAWVGSPLVDRTKSPVALTSVGQLFLSTAKEIVALLADTRGMAAEMAEGPARRIAIATGRTLSHTILPALTSRLRHKFGVFNLKVCTVSTTDGIKMLGASDVDFLLCYKHLMSPETMGPAPCAYKTVGVERIIAVSVPAARGVPLYPVPRHAAWTRTPFLSFHPDMSLGKTVRGIIDRANLGGRLQVVYESDIADSIYTMATQGAGLAWLPESLIKTDLAAGTLVRADAPSFDEECQMRIYRSISNPKPFVRQVWKEINQW